MGNTQMAKRKEKVTRVIDGDTFLTASRKHPVRLANVDAPETKKAKEGPAATRKLRRLIEGKQVVVQTVARDVYGRAVAKVYVGAKLINKGMNRKSGRSAKR